MWQPTTRLQPKGPKVVDQLAADLHSSFPNDKGFSPRNLKYMRRFAVEWPDFAMVQDALAQLPWYQHIALWFRCSGILFAPTAILS